MARLNIAPTKSNQIALKRDLKMASQGFSLLEQKREILVMELMRMLDRVKQVQQEIKTRSDKAYATLRQALSYNGYHHLRNIASGIHYERTFKDGTRVSAGVRYPSLKVTQSEFHSQFGFVGTDSLVDQTMEDFLKLTEAAARLAELETGVWLLARELKKTQRRVNALEHIFIPNYKDTLHFIGESLEGKELDSFFTMKMVKKRLEKSEVIAKLPPNRQDAASEGEERKRSVVTTLSLSDEAIAPRREGGWDESFAITSSDSTEENNGKGGEIE